MTLHSLCYDSACPVTPPPVMIGYIIQQGNGYYLYMFKLWIEKVIYFLTMSFGNPLFCCWCMCVLHVLFVILLQIHVQLKQGFNTIITMYIISSNMIFLNTKNDLFLKEHKSKQTRKLCWIRTRMNMFGQRHIDKSHVCESICSNYE
jgi:hypothetical protein